MTLSISLRTVSNHVASILRKLGAETRAGGVRRAAPLGVLSADPPAAACGVSGPHREPAETAPEAADLAMEGGGNPLPGA